MNTQQIQHKSWHHRWAHRVKTVFLLHCKSIWNPFGKTALPWWRITVFEVFCSELSVSYKSSLRLISGNIFPNQLPYMKNWVPLNIIKTLQTAILTRQSSICNYFFLPFEKVKVPENWRRVKTVMSHFVVLVGQLFEDKKKKWTLTCPLILKTFFFKLGSRSTHRCRVNISVREPTACYWHGCPQSPVNLSDKHEWWSNFLFLSHLHRKQ